jgi:hypothetical protein
MLKLIYSEVGLCLEQIVNESLDQWITQRSILALRMGQSVCMHPGRASFLTPASALTVHHLDLDWLNSPHCPISYCSVDEDFYEVNLVGVWISQHGQGSEGLFAATLGAQAESFVWQLWKSSQQSVPDYSEFRSDR